MNLADRRGIIRFALSAALLPALSSQTARAAMGQTRTISPPSGPMIYRRSVLRTLPDGLVLTVERSFTVQFAPMANGYRLTGTQASAQVSAPPSLDAFARLEEQRVEQGVFPLLLDGTGLIVGAPSVPRAQEVAEALAVLEARMGYAGKPPQSDDEMAQIARSLHDSGTQIGSHLPPDLFAPVDEDWQEQREIALPWGDTGSVLVEFDARRDSATGLMREATRAVTTRLGEDSRRATETWELGPA